MGGRAFKIKPGKLEETRAQKANNYWKKILRINRLRVVLSCCNY
jgi:hypothetical protein